MRFRIHGRWPDGTEDSIVIETDTIEELQEIAQTETQHRNWCDCWSEDITD